MARLGMMRSTMKMPSMNMQMMSHQFGSNPQFDQSELHDVHHEDLDEITNQFGLMTNGQQQQQHHHHQMEWTGKCLGHF